MNTTTTAIGFQSKLFNSRLIASHETLRFTDHKPTQRAMEIAIRFVNCDDLRSEFYCRRAELTRRYGCSDKHGTKLFRGMIDRGLIEVVKEYFDLNTRKYVRTFRLTEKSVAILEKSLMISEGIEKAARVNTEHTSCEKRKKEVPNLMMNASREKSKKFKKKKKRDQPWMIARDLFGRGGSGHNNYSFADFNDCMTQVVEKLGGCAKTREYFKAIYDTVDGHTSLGRRRAFARFCTANEIYPRTRDRFCS